MSVHTYRLKPPTVEAFQIHPNDGLTRMLPPHWMVDALYHGVVIPAPDGGLTVKGMRGVVTGKVGDWVVNDGGRFDVMPDAHFKRKYERAE